MIFRFYIYSTPYELLVCLIDLFKNGAIKSLLLRVWPLPRVGQRRNSVVPLRWIHREFQLDRDADYICYRAFHAALVTNAVLFALLYADYFAGTHLLSSLDRASATKISLTRTLQRLSLIPTILISLSFYLRYRLTVDLRTEVIPITVMRSHLETYPRRNWIRWASFGIIVCIAIVCLGYHAVDRFILHFDGGESVGLIALMQLPLQVIGSAFVPLLFIANALMLEKSIRFFPEAQNDLKRRRSDF